MVRCYANMFLYLFCFGRLGKRFFLRMVKIRCCITVVFRDPYVAHAVVWITVISRNFLYSCVLMHKEKQLFVMEKQKRRCPGIATITGHSLPKIPRHGFPSRF